MTKPLATNSPDNLLGTLPTIKKQYHLLTGNASLTNDLVIVEEPLQISLLWFNPETQTKILSELAVVMRTPGADKALVTGLLFAEGIIKRYQDIINVSVPPDCENDNQIEVELAAHITINWQSISRSFASLSSCGLCGKTSLKSLTLKSHQQINSKSAWLTINELPTLSEGLTQLQTLFQQTGGVHGAALFQDQAYIAVAEDVGRHNAVDKVIGQIIQQNTQLAQAILLLTGRVSFELMQKAVMAAIPVVIAVGAPSSLAIAVAKQFDITLIGFNKNQQFNVYHGGWRLLDNKTS